MYILAISAFATTLLPMVVLCEECLTAHTSRSYLNGTFSTSQILLSGTVDKITLISGKEDVVQQLKIRVKRVYKGGGHVNSRTSIDVNVPRNFEFCITTLLVQDTRVFPLSSDGDVLTLSSPVLPITLRVLDSLHSFILKKPHKKRRKAKPNRCESKLCPLGSKCVFSTGKCECRSHCRSTGPAVCGSDRVSYASACHLFVRSCLLAKKGVHLRMVGSEACRKRGPCDDLRCGPGEDCVVTQKDGVLSAQCVCPTFCPSYGDSVESSPVCSSQGLDYPSLCHLKQHACHTQTNITVRYFGQCDPCAGVDCARGTRCKLSSTRRPECRCSEQCALNFDPVCADNGLTYTNECVMHVSACKEDTHLTVYRKGKCSDVRNPCDDKECTRGSRCHIAANGTANCICPQKCPEALTPVCGTDGVTYDNECEVHRHACLERTHIAVRHRGPCGEGLCASFTCQSPLSCVVVDEKPTCVCPQCTDELREVCASDGRTYPNECKMHKAACDEGTTLFVKYNGICEGCAKRSCQYYSTCINESGKAECRCPDDCRTNSSSARVEHVCGTDGVTYTSECHLRRSACQQMKFIVVAFEGKCDACINVECGFGEECRGGKCVCSYQCPSSPPSSARVCGEDGVLYISDCHRQLAACRRGTPIPAMPLTHCHSAVAAINDECSCHSLGSFGTKCDKNGICRCRAGVGGAKCDHCLPGFWGLHLIAVGAQSCQPCGCSVFGSSRPDCEQTTGICECSHGARGRSCDECTADFVMTASGCVKKAEFRSPRNCAALQCHYGAKCVDSISGHPYCECPRHCDLDHLGIVANMSVCGSDGNTYEGMCQLIQFACKHQLDLVAVSLGICSDESSESRERSNRDSSKLKKNITCRSPSDCASIGGTCERSNKASGVCKCPFGEFFQEGRCRPERRLSLNLTVERDQVYRIERNGLHFHMNISATIVPCSSDGVILYGRGDRNSFTLRMEMRRIVAEFNSEVLYSTEHVTLGRSYSVGLHMGEKKVSLRVDGSSTVLRVASENEAFSELSVGRHRKTTFNGSVLQLLIDGEAVQPENLVQYSDLWSLYSAPILLGGDDYILLPDVKPQPGPRIDVSLSVNRISKEGLVFLWGSPPNEQQSKDYIAMLLVDAQLQLFWSIGPFTNFIRTPSILPKAVWNEVRFELLPSAAAIYVNGSADVSSSFTEANDRLQFRGGPVFLGGVSAERTIPEELLKFEMKFVGAVKRLEMDEIPLNLHRGSNKRREISANGKTAECSSASTDEDLQAHENGARAAFFNGSEEYAYLSGGTTPEPSSNSSEFSFEFRSVSGDGVLWWESSSAGSKRGDFLIIHLRKGRVNVAVNLGRDALKSVTTNLSVLDGKWHRVAVQRRDLQTTIGVDGKMTTIVSSSEATQLNTNGLVYLGGRRRHGLKHKFKGTFAGCIRRLTIRGTSIDLHSDVVSARSPPECRLARP